MATFGTRLLAELRGDRVIWMIVLLLALLSVLAVYSSIGTKAYMSGVGSEYYLLKHFIIMIGGIGLTYMCYLLHYQYFAKWAPYLLILSIPLLFFTLFSGTEINDARRWLTIPIIDLTFQTSDFAKLALIVYVAQRIGAKQEYIKDFQSAFLPLIVPVLIICGLIAPADLSTAMLLFFTCIMMMFMGRVSLKYIWLLMLLGIVVFASLIILGNFFPDYIRVETWTNRVNEFAVSADGAEQVQQSKVAIARGGIIGSGPGNSIQRNILPAAYSDFIYAIICEEYGLLGGLAILGLYVLLFLRCVRLVARSPKAFGAMLTLGMGLLIVFQALANMAVSVDLVPVTGLTLPLVSMGGTSVLFSSIMIGMILSVSKYLETTNLEDAIEDNLATDE